MTVLLKRILLLLLLVVIGSVVGLRLGLPLLADKALRDYFGRHKTTFTAKTFDFNILTGTLDLTGISLKSSQQAGPFTIQHIVAEIDLLPLLNRHWQINALAVESPRIQLTPSDEGWTLGSIPLQQHLAALFSEESESDSRQPWSAHMTYARLSNADISVKDASATHWQIQLLEVNEWQVRQDDWKLGLSAEGRLNGAAFKIQTHFQGNASRYTHWFDLQHFQGTLADLAPWLPASLNTSHADLDITGEFLLSQTPTETRLTSTQSHFVLRNANLNLETAAIQTVQAEGKLGQMVISHVDDQANRIELKGTFSGKDTLVWTPDRNHILAGAGQWKTGDFALLQNQQLTFLTPAFELQDLLIGDSPEGDPPLPTLLTLHALKLENFHLQSGRLHADRLELDGPHFVMELDDQGQLLNGLPTQSWTGILRKSGLGAESLSVYQVKQTAPGTIEFLRRNPSASPPENGESAATSPLFSATLTSLELEGLDTGSTDQALHMLVALQAKEAPRLSMDARLWPFAQQFALDMRGDLAIDQPKRLRALLTSPLSITPQVERSPLQANLQISVSQGVITGEWQPYTVDLSGEHKTGTVTLLQGALTEGAQAKDIIQTLAALIANRL